MSYFTEFISYEANLTKKYDFRFFVFFCFLLQTFLSIAAPFRKRTSNRVYLCSIWLAFLISDWASNFTLGLIPVDQKSSETGQQSPAPAPSTQNDTGLDSNILMLWAPFVLVHMGGVDSIAALSSSDNDLWSRFAIQLALNIYAITKAFSGYFGGSKVKYVKVLAMLMLVAGCSRFVERILCLFQARFSALKESMLEQRQKSKSSQNSLQFDGDEEEEHSSHGLSDAKILSHAYRMFESFKVLFVDLHVEDEDRRKSREYFTRRNPGEAFRVVEIELNFSYELLYTKGPIIRRGLGRFLHPICIICEVVALALWFRVDKNTFDEPHHKSDILVTYALLVGTLARDVVSILMLALSDWSFANVKSSISSKLVNMWLLLRKRRWDKYSSSKEAPFSIWLSRVFFRRWSESVSQLDLIKTVVFPKKDFSVFWGKTDREAEGFDIVLNKLRKVPKEWFTNDLRDFIFRELKERLTHSEIVVNLVGTSRGQWALKYYRPGVEELVTLSNNWITKKTFDESLLIWHIATTLCYYTNEDNEDQSENQCSKFSKVLSEYMLYLLLRRPEMMLEVAAMGDMRYEATLNKAKSFVSSLSSRHRRNQGEEDRLMESACQRMLSRLSSDEGDEYSMLYDACRLAKELKVFKDRRVIKMWEVIGKVWVEMLIYASVRCSPSAHAAELANGGELLTLVWLLTQHFGLGK